MKFKTFLEFFNNFTYKVPTDKEHLLYDFFMMSMLSGYFKHNLNNSGDRENELNTMFKETEDILLPHLKKEMLDIAFFAMCSEVRHAVDQFHTNAIEGENGKVVRKDTLMNSPEGKMFKKDFLPFKNASKQDQRTAAWDAMMNTFDTKKEAVTWMQKLFSEPYWDHMYGGKPWVEISDAWLKLYNAKTKNDLYVYINLMYTLEHNTGSVFNKSELYKIDSFRKVARGKEDPHAWIARASNDKHHVNEPIELIDKLSPGMKSLALKILKNKENQTQDTSVELDKMNSQFQSYYNQSYSGGLFTFGKMLYFFDKQQNQVVRYFIQKNYSKENIAEAFKIKDYILEGIQLCKQNHPFHWFFGETQLHYFMSEQEFDDMRLRKVKLNDIQNQLFEFKPEDAKIVAQAILNYFEKGGK